MLCLNLIVLVGGSFSQFFVSFKQTNRECFLIISTICRSNNKYRKLTSGFYQKNYRLIKPRNWFKFGYTIENFSIDKIKYQ